MTEDDPTPSFDAVYRDERLAVTQLADLLVPRPVDLEAARDLAVDGNADP